MPQYDVLTENWIPVEVLDGKSKLVNMLEVILQAHKIRCVKAASPLITYGIQRTLIALLTDAIRPRNMEALTEIIRKGEFDGFLIEDYMGVRADRKGIMLEDFHTVTGERGFLFNTKGERRNSDEGATIITPRQFLQDACFTVALSAQESLIMECAAAILDPVWPIYLGRKCCIPSCPVFED